MNAPASIVARAVVAVGLMIGFYVLALATSLALFYVPVAEVMYLKRIHIKLTIGCVGGGLAILWSIVPRRDRFEAPGPTLTEPQHPLLFAQLRSVADATRQAMPAEVFLVGDVNAWVAQRGGVMGFFSRRVMGLGLPLLETLTITEFRAVLAHEFGHFDGGDTRLGPWIYKTRAAIGRTLAGLGDSILQKPFLWYGQLFLRVSHAVSRRQEFSADALASRVVGAGALVTGLQKVQTAALAFDSYWSREVTPVLQAGFLPPLTEGFRRFVSNPQVKSALDVALEQALREQARDPYDTHPPLPDRIAAVASLPRGPVTTNEAHAITLLGDVPTLERRWLAIAAGDPQVESLTPVAWDTVVVTAFLPAWRDMLRTHAAVLEGATIDQLAAVVTEAEQRARGMAVPEGADLEARTGFVRWLAAVGTTVAMDRAGWTISTTPGAPITVTHGGDAIGPFEIVQQLAEGTLTAAEWSARATQLGIGELTLVEPSPQSTS